MGSSWRTPDPSPTRTAAGLPRRAPSELKLTPQFIEVDDMAPTPRSRHGVAHGRGAHTSRTPSPVAIQQHTNRPTNPVRTLLPPMLSPGSFGVDEAKSSRIQCDDSTSED